MKKPVAITATDVAHELTKAVRIVHHIPGRIRLKLVGDLPWQKPAESDIKSIVGKLPAILKSMEKIPGVRSVKANLLARSCVVEYDVRQIPDAAWTNLLSGKDTPESNALRDLLIDKAREIQKDLS